MPPGPPPGPPIPDAAPVPPPGLTQPGAPPPVAGPPGPLPQPLAGGGPSTYQDALPPPLPPAPIPGKPDPADIDTAASVMQKALEVVLDNEHSNEAIKNAIKDVLLPGRGVARVRWKPEMKTEPVMAGDGTTPLPAGGVAGAEPATTERKVWEEVLDEYVIWEDILLDPVRQAGDTDWIAFRHLFTKESLEREFAGSPEYDKLKAANQTESLFRWT